MLQSRMLRRTSHQKESIISPRKSSIEVNPTSKESSITHQQHDDKIDDTHNRDSLRNRRMNTSSSSSSSSSSISSSTTHSNQSPNNDTDSIDMIDTSTSKDYVKVETEVIYPKNEELETSKQGFNLGKNGQFRSNKSEKNRSNGPGNSKNNTNDNSNGQENEELPQQQQIVSSPTAAVSSSSSSSCPPLIIPSSKYQSILNQYNDNIPSFHTRFQCNSTQSISTHPYLYLSFIITILLFTIYTYKCRKPNHHSRFKNPFQRQRNDINHTRDRGEYSALETVYDELLDDFENEDLSSYLQSDDDSDDSVGTIISQWSEHDGDHGKIELTGFEMK